MNSLENQLVKFKLVLKNAEKAVVDRLKAFLESAGCHVLSQNGDTLQVSASPRIISHLANHRDVASVTEEKVVQPTANPVVNGPQTTPVVPVQPQTQSQPEAPNQRPVN